MLKRRLFQMALMLSIATTAAACGGGGDGGDGGKAAQPDPAEASGSAGTYTAPADPSALCKGRKYQAFADWGGPSGDPKAKTLGSNPSSSTSASCMQTTSGGGGDSGLVDTQITFWHDVDLAKSQFAYGKGADVKDFAKDAHADPQSGVGAEAYRYVRKESDGGVYILELAARHSNVEITVRVIATSKDDWTQQRVDKVFGNMAVYIRTLFADLHNTAPAASVTP